MDALERLAEARIQEAVDRGELQGLAGEGRPLQLDDDSAVPEALRAAYRLLRNAGFVPPELALEREIRDVEALLRQTRDPADADPTLVRARARLEILRLRRAEAGAGPVAAELAYRQRILERLR